MPLYQRKNPNPNPIPTSPLLAVHGCYCSSVIGPVDNFLREHGAHAPFHFLLSTEELCNASPQKVKLLFIEII